MNYSIAGVEMKEFRDINSGKEVFYNFLSRSYKKEVDEDFLAMLVSLMPYIESIASQSDIDSMDKGVILIRGVANRLTGLDAKGKEDILLDLARDFCSLFLIGVKSVPNSESVYLSSEHIVKQEPRDMALKIYRETGFDVSKEFNEPEDHIALELEFMARLSQLVCESIDREDDDSLSKFLNCQKQFMEEHLNKWIPQFVSFLLKSTDDRDFYKAIAYLTKGFIEMDYRFIKEAVINAG